MLSLICDLLGENASSSLGDSSTGSWGKLGMVGIEMGLDLGGNGAKSTLATINHTILGPMLKDGIELVHG